MAIIGKVVYDHKGELVFPSRASIEAAKSSLDLDLGGNGSRTGDEVDRTHVIEINGYGSKPAEARRDASARLNRFFDAFEGKYGFRRLSVRRIRQSTAPVNGSCTLTYEVVYAIEYNPARRPRTHEPESPHAGYRRDTATVVRRQRKLTAP